MFGLLPKNLEFFDCFDQAAKNAVRSAELLVELATSSDRGRRVELVGAIKEKEHTGDHIAHEALDRLEKTYLTPIDRDDIQALVTQIDDIVDYVDAAAQRLMIYKIVEITPAFQDQCRGLVKATESLAEAVAGLRFLKNRRRGNSAPNIEQAIIAIHETENASDDVHHRSLGELFECGFDPFMVIKWKELYEIVEQAIDRCEDVANTVQGIAIKSA